MTSPLGAFSTLSTLWRPSGLTDHKKRWSVPLCAALVAFCSLAFASEHHGMVKFGGLPVPGATVTATQADKRFTAITDQQGAYFFPDLPDGVWRVRVEMLCFAPLEREVAVSAQAPAGEWELKLLPVEQMGAVDKGAAAHPVGGKRSGHNCDSKHGQQHECRRETARAKPFQKQFHRVR